MASQRRSGLRATVTLFTVALALAGCVGDVDPGVSERAHDQAEAALARWDEAVAAAGGQQGFALVGDATGQVGDWEVGVGDNDKVALMAGAIETAVGLSTSRGEGQVGWSDGRTLTVGLVSASEAMEQIRAGGSGPCGGCDPLRVIGAQLTTARVETTRGPAIAPVWAFDLAGTAVRVTRVAVAPSAAVEPAIPSWDPNDTPVGIAIDEATGSPMSRELTVSFTGAPDPASRPCGADYTAEAVESSLAVVVIVAEHRNPLPVPCAAVGAVRTAVAQLAAPLADRAVLEGREGRPVPVRLTP